MSKPHHGFTLLELTTVTAIISILAMIAVPAYSNYLKRAKVSEAFMLSSALTKRIGDYYSFYGKFPKDHQALALPPPENLGGRFVKSMQVADGAIHIKFAEDDTDLANAILSLRPAIVIAYPPTDAITWVCGYATAVAGMTLIGDNQTTIKRKYLPKNCF